MHYLYLAAACKYHIYIKPGSNQCINERALQEFDHGLLNMVGLYLGSGMHLNSAFQPAVLTIPASQGITWVRSQPSEALA